MKSPPSPAAYAALAIQTVIAVATEGDVQIQRYSDHVVYVPDAPEPLQPLLTVVPLQLMAYHAAVARESDELPVRFARAVDRVNG